MTCIAFSLLACKRKVNEFLLLQMKVLYSKLELFSYVVLLLDISVLESVSFSVLNCFHFQYSILFKNIQEWIFIPFLDELDNSKHLKLKTLKRWFSAQNPIMCAIFGPKNGDFQKMLRIVWNGEKCNKIKNLKNFFYHWIFLNNNIVFISSFHTLGYRS